VLTLYYISFLAHGLYGIENAYPDARTDKCERSVSCGSVILEHIRTGNTAYQECDYGRADKDLPAVLVKEYPPALAEIYPICSLIDERIDDISLICKVL
jgi:hypothetical protein